MIMIKTVRDFDRRQLLRWGLGGALSFALLDRLASDAKAGNYVAPQSNLNVLAWCTSPWSGSITYLPWSSGQNFAAAIRHWAVSLTGKPSGTLVGESDQCVALTKALTGAPATANWRRGRRVVGSNLARGTAIAVFSSNGTYGVHTGILAGYRSDGSFDIWDQNWVSPSIITRHTISGTSGGGVSDRNAYWEIVT